VGEAGVPEYNSQSYVNMKYPPMRGTLHICAL
jgi:hypothetical protein